MMRRLLYAAVIAVLAIVGIAAFYAFGRGPSVGLGPTPSPTTQETQAESPTASWNTSPIESPIDTTSWTTYQSDRYGFSIGHPSDWTEVPADHDWTFEADGDDWLSTAQEAFFTSLGEGVRVGAWGVAADPATTDVATWVADYCEKTNNSPCTGIAARAVPLCIEARDCHPGLLVPFEGDVQAFFIGGAYDKMIVVAVWWGESEPAVAPYGGSRRLLEAFLATMGVCEANDGYESRGVGC